MQAECSMQKDRRDKQAGHKPITSVADWTGLDTIVVVFSHLLSGGKIPKKVQQNAQRPYSLSSGRVDNY